MTAEQSFFLRCIADFLHGRKTEIPDKIDTEQIVIWAKQQQAEGIIFYQCREADFASSLEKYFSSNTFYSANRMRLLAEIDKAFSENGISYLIFKGSEISRYYPVPSLRTMGDSDILVHTEDKEKAHSVLTSIGMERTLADDGAWVYYKNSLSVELHHALLYERIENRECDLDFASRVWEHTEKTDGVRYTLELEFHLVYLLLHIKTHLMCHGLGIRQFTDLAALALNADVDWDKVRKYLDGIDLTEFAESCFALCNRWFEVEIPITKELSGDFFEEATRQLIKNGVFGKHNSENDVNQLTNKVRKDDSVKPFAFFIRKLFPTYEYMCKYEEFSFVKGRKYLMPIAWIYRFGYDITHSHTKSGIKTAVSPYAKKDEINKRNEFLKEFGL